ncbi:MAG: two-component system response regulator [Myxococcota bacterium]
MTSVQDTRQTILLVDDTPENVIILGAQLKQFYRVRVANSGPRALKVALSPPVPDLILLDIMMPDMDGYAVLGALQRDPLTQKIPVIFVSALNSPEEEEKGLAVGAVDYITKPVRPAMLLNRVQLHLEQERLRRLVQEYCTRMASESARRLSLEQQVERVTLRALMSLIEIQHPDSYLHLTRSANLLEMLARSYFENPWPADAHLRDHVQELTLASGMHDIGMVAVPAQIVSKRGPLTHEEHQLLERHCELGAQAIERAIAELEQPSPLLYIARDIAASHHERWDGLGYPRGRAGLEIPLGARLMSLADNYDALTHARPYQPSMDHHHAVERLQLDAGTHFDPRIWEAFLKIADRLPNVTHIPSRSIPSSPLHYKAEDESTSESPEVQN